MWGEGEKGLYEGDPKCHAHSWGESVYVREGGRGKEESIL